MPGLAAGLGRKARLNLAPPFHSLIRRLIHPVTRVTIRAYDLLSSRPDGEIEREEEDGEGYRSYSECMCDWAGPGLWRERASVRVHNVGRMKEIY